MTKIFIASLLAFTATPALADPAATVTSFVETADLDLDTRILAVCDVYDALISTRVYRAAWSAEKALGLLLGQAGSAFDNRVVNALARVLAREPASPLREAV